VQNNNNWCEVLLSTALNVTTWYWDAFSICVKCWMPNLFSARITERTSEVNSLKSATETVHICHNVALPVTFKYHWISHIFVHDAKLWYTCPKMWKLPICAKKTYNSVSFSIFRRWYLVPQMWWSFLRRICRKNRPVSTCLLFRHFSSHSELPTWTPHLTFTDTLGPGNTLDADFSVLLLACRGCQRWGMISTVKPR